MQHPVNTLIGIANSVTSGATGFTVYVVDLGNYAGTEISITFGGDALPDGTILAGELPNSGCTAALAQCSGVDAMPASALLAEDAPELATLALVGSGMLLFGVVLRKRWRIRG